MNAKTIFTFAGGVVAGLILGALLFSGPTSQQGVQQATPVAQQQQQQQPGVDKIRLQKEIAQLEGIVKSDPNNYDAWKRMGDSLFDIEQPQRSIEAYRKALAINGDDPNVWTDMGVMYRRIGDFTKALESFEEAIKRNDAHAISILNKGVVYLFDLKEIDKGIAAWERFLELQPTGPQADQVRSQLGQFKSMQAVQSGETELPADHPPIPPPTEGGQPAPQGGGDPAGYFPKPEQQ